MYYCFVLSLYTLCMIMVYTDKHVLIYLNLKSISEYWVPLSGLSKDYEFVTRQS